MLFTSSLLKTTGSFFSFSGRMNFREVHGLLRVSVYKYLMPQREIVLPREIEKEKDYFIIWFF